MIEIVLMDFNGVIIDDESLHFRSYQKVFETEGLTITQEEYNDSFGMNDRALIRDVYTRAGQPLGETLLEDLVIRKTGAYTGLLGDETPLFPGAVTFIKGLRSHFGVGLVSMAQRVEIDHVLARAGLSDAFDTIVSAEDVTTHKPDPACYFLGRERAARAVHKQGKPTPALRNCAVIEDTPAGVQAGVNAGMRVIGIANTVSPAELRRAGAEAVFHTLADCNAGTIYSLLR